MADNYIVKSEELKQIADAIREKTGTSDSLEFPTAMAEAIAAIEAGGGNELYSGVKYATGTQTLSTSPTYLYIDDPFNGTATDLVFGCVYPENGVSAVSSSSTVVLASAIYKSNVGHGSYVYKAKATFANDSPTGLGPRMCTQGGYLGIPLQFLFSTGTTGQVFEAGIEYRWILLTR